MFVISTRNFPPDVGGMQNLIGGLANALVNHGPVKVFADQSERFEEYDKVSKASISDIFGLAKVFSIFFYIIKFFFIQIFTLHYFSII